MADSIDARQVTLYGIGFKVLNCVCFTLISVIARLVLADGGVFQLFFISIGVACVIMLPWVIYKGYGLPDKHVWKHYIALGGLGVVGMTLWFRVVTMLPIAFATGLSYTTPLFTTLLAIIFLKEPIHRHHLVALVVGFCGALMIIRPEASTLLVGSLLVLLNALIWAVYDLVTKLQTVKEKPPMQAFYVLVLHFIFAAPIALSQWTTPSSSELLGSLLIGGLFILNLMALFNAYRFASLTLLMPFSFSRLIFAAIMGWFIFNETLSMSTLLGGGIILMSSFTLFILTYKRQRTSKAV